MIRMNGIKNTLAVGIIILLIGSAVALGINSGANHIIKGRKAIKVDNENVFSPSSKICEFSQDFSLPEINDEGEYLNIHVKESNSVTTTLGKPLLPVFSKVIKLPLGTKITNIECITSKIKTMEISKKIKPVPQPAWMDKGKVIIEKSVEKKIYGGLELYPSNWHGFKTGGGLNNDGNHVTILSIHVYPVRYLPVENILEFVDNIMIKVTYEEAQPLIYNDEYDMSIIAPSEFSEELQPLIDHKNNHNVNTLLKTTEEIYAGYNGQDEAEQIKYFIKDAIETWGIDYVLLIGSIEKLPIRTTWIYQRWHNHYWNETILSDLYYADIYDANGDFCSWDSNDNGIYGENYQNCPGVNDTVDLYPDINIGRLACVNEKEVRTIVDKIIHYETETYGESWFNNIVLCGGDTFPGWDGNEGEEKNKITEQTMSGFVPTKLWTSDNTFSPRTVNQAINTGAGFVDYSGHGFEIGIGTHPPNDESWKYYHTYHMLGLTNQYKLPIIFFDACLTAKLDFNVSEFIGYLSKDLQVIVNKFEPISSKLLPCFAWYWVRKSNGGAIATIGATRTAYGSLEMGCGYISLKFYEAYSSSETVSQMLTKAQNDYINNLWRDYFTLEEFILLGDPSLKIGGYS